MERNLNKSRSSKDFEERRNQTTPPATAASFCNRAATRIPSADTVKQMVKERLRGQRMKTIAYLRVSTAQQDAGSQRLAILEHARKNGFRIDDFVEATARGQASAKHRRLDELIGTLKRGDRLVVSELSRLGRSLG